MEPTSSSEVVKGEFKNISWELKRFGQDHEILTAARVTSSVVEFENPKVRLRYFLQPVEKIRKDIDSGYEELICKYYNLCVELLEANSNCVVNVNAEIYVPLSNGDNVTGDGSINANASKNGQNFTIIEEFLPVVFPFLIEIPL